MIENSNPKRKKATVENTSTQDKVKLKPQVTEEKITVDRKIKDEMKRREQDQTQELLIGLTNELYEKLEKVNPEKKPEAQEIPKPKSKSESTPESKIEFTDLSWYQKKLNSKGEKTYGS